MAYENEEISNINIIRPTPELNDHGLIPPSFFLNALTDKQQAEPLSCKLLDSFAIIVQIFMACIALSSLFVKRQRESPRRPLFIWMLDTSKQALAASFIHIANILLSYISTAIIGGEKKPEGSTNPCTWYFLNILLDTTIGVVILYFFLKLFHGIAEYYKVTEIESGIYGDPPRMQAWLKQLGLFLVSWFCVKIVVVVSLTLFPFLSILADILLSPLMQTGNTRLLVVFVMLIFPLIMNIIQAWLIDYLIKGKFTKAPEQEDLLEFEDDVVEYENYIHDEEGNVNNSSHTKTKVINNVNDEEEEYHDFVKNDLGKKSGESTESIVLQASPKVSPRAEKSKRGKRDYE